MISFSTLGKTGARLGNQLFQYAYIRAQAKRMGVKFYSPTWLGDSLFTLRDGDEKGDLFKGSEQYNEDPYKHGFNQSAFTIQDGTEVNGYFQSYKYFTEEDIAKWFLFNEDMVHNVREKYKAIDFTNAVAVHVRLGDYLQGSLMFYVPTPEYFKNALMVLKPQGTVLIFSENADLVKKYLGEMPENVMFIDGNKDYEDFYLMSLCRDIVISPSSFSWWAAYINKHKDKRVVIPTYWYIPGCPVKNKDICVNGWLQLPGHRILVDNYYFRYIRIFLRKIFK